MLIRVKERGFGIRKIERTKRERESRTRKRRNEKKNKALGNCLLDQNSSVEVGYGFYTIRSKLLIANDMYWVVL